MTALVDNRPRPRGFAGVAEKPLDVERPEFSVPCVRAVAQVERHDDWRALADDRAFNDNDFGCHWVYREEGMVLSDCDLLTAFKSNRKTSLLPSVVAESTGDSTPRELETTPIERKRSILAFRELAEFFDPHQAGPSRRPDPDLRFPVNAVVDRICRDVDRFSSRRLSEPERIAQED